MAICVILANEVMPFMPTPEQKNAVWDVAVQLKDTRKPLYHLVSGYVGCGKTAVYGVIAASVADAGGKVVVMLPNQVLAAQVAEEISQWWPDLGVTFVSENQKKG